MRTTDSTSSRRLAAVPNESVYRACELCLWDIHRDQVLVADLDAATHWMTAHATPAERERIAARVEGWRTHWNTLGTGEFPAHLLVRIVDETRTSGSTAGEVAA